jgi:hypothetical protein
VKYYGELSSDPSRRGLRDDTLGVLKDLIASVDDANFYIDFIKNLKWPTEIIAMQGSHHGDEGHDPRNQYGLAVAFFVRVMESTHRELLQGKSPHRGCVTSMCPSANLARQTEQLPTVIMKLG